MTNLEGIAKRLFKNGKSEEEILTILTKEYEIWKDLDETVLQKMAKAVYEESKKSLMAINIGMNYRETGETTKKIMDIIAPTESGVTMGEGGVGCRGKGDFFVHKLISKLSKGPIKPYISPESLDDTGAIKLDCGQEEKIILTKMEGMHSRLSDFPFLAGFHVTRAALRDIYVKGGIPLSIMVDVHLADDGDIGALFDYQAGIAAVAELTHVPITAGSTLRIGGDMVIGDRLTGGIAAIGEMKYNFFRKNIKENDVILMTEGAGGGTVSTTALYIGLAEYVKETLNIKFLQASEALFNNPEICKSIRAMADVTNGGLRGDLYEINHESGFGVKVYPNKVKKLVNPFIMDLFDKTNVDYLGVSLDALLIYCAPEVESEIISTLEDVNVKCSRIGHVIQEQKVVFVSEDGKDEKIMPRFRESAYTEIKKVVDTEPTENINENIKMAFDKAQEKKKSIIKLITEE